MGITCPGESPEYRAARDRLLGQETELRRATETVAAIRRELPPGGRAALQLEGAADHLAQHVNLVVVAKTPLPRLLAFVEERGWRRLRFLSSATNTYNADYHA